MASTTPSLQGDTETQRTQRSRRGSSDARESALKPDASFFFLKEVESVPRVLPGLALASASLRELCALCVFYEKAPGCQHRVSLALLFFPYQMFRCSSCGTL